MSKCGWHRWVRPCEASSLGTKIVVDMDIRVERSSLEHWGDMGLMASGTVPLSH